VAGNPTNGQMNGSISYSNEAKHGSFSLRSPGGSGANDRLQISGNLTDLDMNGPYSFMAWVKAQGGGNGQGIVVLGSCCSPRQGYTMMILNDGKVRFWAGANNNDNNHNTYSSQTVNNGQWRHIGVRVKPGKVEILIDGAVSGSNGESNIPTSPSKANANNDHAPHCPHVGGEGVSSAKGTEVLIDEVRVYRKWLDNSQWAQAMNGI